MGNIIGGPKAPPPPKIEPPAPMPDPEAGGEAKRRKIAALQSRSGRASTILTGDERLGG